MSEQYLAHFAVIVLPLFIVQVWTYRRSFYTLPWRLHLMALYGAAGAIWSQHYPTHGFGISASFASIPIIISFLYGKRLAGSISAASFALWTLWLHPHAVYAVTVSIVFYSILPFLLAPRYEGFRRRTRLLFAILISFWTILVQGITWVTDALVTHPTLVAHPTEVFHEILVKLLPFLGVALVIQATLTMIPILMLDSLIEDGKLRLAMADNEHRYHSMIEFNPLGISIIDRDNRFVHANPAYQQISGYRLAELIGRSRFDLWFPEDLPFASQMSKTLETGEVLVDLPGGLRRKDGRRIEVRFSSVPIFVNGVVTGYFNIVNDVTESVRMEKHLREADKLSIVGQLAASIAHEIRNPLTALSGFLSLMAEQAAGGDTQQSDTATPTYLNVMKDELNRINFIASQLLMLGKPQSEHFSAHDVRTIASEVMTLLEPQINMLSVRHTVQLPETEVFLWCDRNQIKQALINIVKNAIEVTGNGGSISVTVHHGPSVAPSDVAIVVRDSGPGIRPEVLERLGEPFYTTKPAGTGLGLMVTKRIVESHKGTIEFQSTLGEGTIVKLAFPPTVEAAAHVSGADFVLYSE